jgi:regulator of sigma E protease
LNIIGIISGVIAFIIIIAIHEYGHLLSGQLFGVPIKSFAIGFGPEAKVLFYRKGVRYVLNWIPLGGYVSFYEREEVFNRKARTLDDISPFKRLIIFAAGPLINILCACVIMSSLVYYTGDEVYDNGIVINEVYPNSPAESAQLQPGDIVLSIADQDVTPDIDIADIAVAHAGQSIPVKITRNNQVQTLNIVPGPWSYGGNSTAVGYGIGIQQLSHQEYYGIFESLQLGFSRTKDIVSYNIMGFLPQNNQDSSGSMGFLPQNNQDSSGSAVTGVVGMVRETGNVYEQYGIIGFLQMFVVLNIGIAVFNLIPFPGLDGSHMLISLIEIITRRKFPITIKNIVSNIGLALMLAFVVFLFIRDIWNWITGV